MLLPEKLHSQILRALENKLARPLRHILNNSVETGIISEDWKKNVTAIHKKGRCHMKGIHLETTDLLV